MDSDKSIKDFAQRSDANEPALAARLNDTETRMRDSGKDEKAFTVPGECDRPDAKQEHADSQERCESPTFKRPTFLVGPKRSRPITKISANSEQPSHPHSSESSDRCSNQETDARTRPQDPPLPYTEPPWGGKSKRNYKLEVLKSGVIVDTLSLNEKSFYVVGRLPSCHISLAHPTISRYHAVLQYRSEEDEEGRKGFYVYDLESTHGTFWNGSRIKPNVYVRVRGGHMLRFGCSQRKYILQAPPDDQEEESLFTVTELKEMRDAELEKRRATDRSVGSPEKEEDDGIDWGMGEDADEETDVQENPYASTADDDLVLDDPKKTLRGWFEREGYDLRYQTEEKGVGQFLCWVDLPMDDIVGRSMRAEALIKGKKKEAVVQCALEACKILDKYGLLRQANHEARKRKSRNWEAEDYYDSDEDNFLDRTGSVEKKREHRMRLAGKLEEKIETYDTLLNRHDTVTKRISHLSTTIENWQNANGAKNESTDEDALDAFMSSLSSLALTKSDIAKMKLELQTLRKEEAGLKKLLNLARPANLPSLSPRDKNTRTVHASKDSPHVGPVEVPSEGTEILGTMARRKKEKQRNRTGADTIPEQVTETAPKQESNSASDDESTVISSQDSLAKNCGSQLESSTSGITDNENVPDEANEKQGKHKVLGTKKRRKERQKIDSDHDVYMNNYSTWVPPQDQAGDGKTSLNEKYGY